MFNKTDKKYIGTNINNIRQEVRNKKNEEIKDKNKKIHLFIMYINKKIDYLLKNSICKNADIVYNYLQLNNIDLKEDILNLYQTDISKFKSTNYDINTLELVYKNKLACERIEAEDFFALVSSNFSELFDLTFNENQDKINIKKVFKKLEAINKKLNTYKKVAGYLKERRRYLNNVKTYKVFLGDLNQTLLSNKHFKVDKN